MDALEFLKERKRMCCSYKHCLGCPLEKLRCALNPVDSDEDNTQVLAAVEQWSKEYARKTRQSEFLKQWPNAKLDYRGGIGIAPCDLDKTMQGKDDNCYYGNCDNCRREFWTQEIV